MYKSKPKMFQVKLAKITRPQYYVFFRSLQDSRVENNYYAMF